MNPSRHSPAEMASMFEHLLDLATHANIGSSEASQGGGRKRWMNGCMTSLTDRQEAKRLPLLPPRTSPPLGVSLFIRIGPQSRSRGQGRKSSEVGQSISRSFLGTRVRTSTVEALELVGLHHLGSHPNRAHLCCGHRKSHQYCRMACGLG